MDELEGVLSTPKNLLVLGIVVLVLSILFLVVEIVAYVRRRREWHRKRIIERWETASKLVEEFLADFRPRHRGEWEILFAVCRTADAERKEVDLIFAHYEPEDLAVKFKREAALRGIQLT